jgi:hypothetical protein
MELVLALMLEPMASALMLTCDQPCPEIPVSCECQETLLHLIWRVNGSDLFPTSMNFQGDDVGTTIYANGFTAVLCNSTEENTTSGFGIERLTSKLNFTLLESINVSCEDNVEHRHIWLQRASKLQTQALSKLQNKTNLFTIIKARGASVLYNSHHTVVALPRWEPETVNMSLPQ